MKKIDAYDLGATLFIPANHKNIEAILCGEKYPELRSIVIDFEDSLLDHEYERVENVLDSFVDVVIREDLLVFVRPRSHLMLKSFLLKAFMCQVDGFILPKVSVSSLEKYLHLLRNSSKLLMPSLESADMFDVVKLSRIRELLLPTKRSCSCNTNGLRGYDEDVKY